MGINPLAMDIGPINDKKNGHIAKVLPGSADNRVDSTRKGASEFATLYVGMMLKAMRGEGKGDTLTGGGRSEETYRSLLDQEYARIIAQSGGTGLTTAIEKELLRLDDCRQENSAGSRMEPATERKWNYHED